VSDYWIGGIYESFRTLRQRNLAASIQTTADRYGHLFPRGDDGSELAAAERAFLRG
jgi:integrase